MKLAKCRELLRHSRNQLQYYTFLLAVVVFGMTALGMVCSILQTVLRICRVLGRGRINLFCLWAFLWVWWGGFAFGYKLGVRIALASLVTYLCI